MADFLNYEQQGPVVTLTMNEPATRNALSGNTAVLEFIEACSRIERDESVRVAIVTGSGDAFSAGGNLNAMRQDWRDHKEGASVRRSLRAGVQRLSLALYGLEVPLIAAVNGPAIGGGCDLACLCDIRIASEKARFAANFVKLGLVPALGGAWLLPRIVGPSRAAQMLLTGEVLDAAAAMACGLVSRIVPHEDLMAAAMAMALSIAASPGHALRMTKGLVRSGGASSFPDHLDTAAGMQALALHTGGHEAALDNLLNSAHRMKVKKETP
jgi:enoyl-CoA hydratase/carnithine racemase